MKKDFRKKIISLRNCIDSDTVNQNSLIITEKLLATPLLKSINTIMVYLDFNNEVKTDYLVTELLNLEKNVVAPITIIKEKKLLPHKITNLHTDIVVGAYGIREPHKDTLSTGSQSIDVVIVPGVAYDINGYRLGYGGGFYDRFLEKLRPDCIKIGIVFDMQVFDEVPKEIHDAKLDYIITEKRIIDLNH